MLVSTDAAGRLTKIGSSAFRIVSLVLLFLLLLALFGAGFVVACIFAYEEGWFEFAAFAIVVSLVALVIACAIRGIAAFHND